MDDYKKLQLKIAFFIFLVLAVGTAGYYCIETGWTFLDALYMTVITITTIGFGETHELSPQGRVFTIGLIAMGLGIVATATTYLARFVVEGELQGIFRRRKMQDKIKKLKEHYIVCGYGRIGSSICLKLFELDISFVIIEPDQERAAVAQRRGFITVCGKATEDETLLFAGLRNAAGVIPCISDDATNIFISLAARELNPDIYIISRASEHEIESRMIRAGADSVVYPLKLGGEQIARIVAERAGKQAAADWSDACAGLLGYHLTMYRSFSETPITVAQARQNADAVTAVALRREFGEVLENPADTELMNRGDQLVCIVTMTAVAAHDNSDAERFTWNDAYRVGVDSIDEEHRVLFRYGRDFEKALAKGLRKQDLDKLFERLLRYTERHFAHEEELMRTHGYLDLDAHIQMHKELTLEVMALYKEKSRVHPRSVVDFLGTWLTTHIVAQDREFAAYLDEATRE